MSRPGGYDYDVALSFAGEDREYVEAVADHLEKAGTKMFYDRFEQVRLWGEDLVVHLDDVYRKKARYCIVFISRAYRDKVWTTHELRSALARAIEERGPYVLPARFDDTEIPGVRPTVGYINLRALTPDAFADVILEKLGQRAATSGDAARLGFRTPKVATKGFNPYEEAQRLIRILADGLRERCEALADRGVSFSEFQRDGRTCLRVVLHGRTRYSLDVWMGGLTGDASVAFAFQRGAPYFQSNAMNAWTTVRWSKARDVPVVPIMDLTSGQDKEYSYTELVDHFWEKICDALEDEQMRG